MFRKLTALVLALATLVCLVSCGSASQTRKGEGAAVLPAATLTKDFTVPAEFKIGLICLHDENSTYDNNFIKGMKAACEVAGLSAEQIMIATNVAESSACYDKAVEFANAGCKVIFADSFGHEEHMAKAAEEYPEVQFCHATGTSSKYGNADLDNFHNAFASIYEGRYLAGIVAGYKLNEMIASGKITSEQAIIGYVGAFTYAEVVSGMTSFYLGAKSVCPSATMKVRYTGSWYDPALEQEAANSLITTDKCVLISQHADSLGAPTACELAKVPNVSYNGSTYSAGKNTFLISSAIDWTPYFLYIIKQVCNGEAIDKDWCGTINTGSIILSGLNLDAVAEGTEEALAAKIAEFKAGTAKVFDTNSFTVTVTADSNTNAIVDADGHLTQYLADVNGDFVGDTNVVHDGFFDESGDAYRSAPYFDIIIDGITNLNVNFGSN